MCDNNIEVFTSGMGANGFFHLLASKVYHLFTLSSFGSIQYLPEFPVYTLPSVSIHSLTLLYPAFLRASGLRQLSLKLAVYCTYNIVTLNGFDKMNPLLNGWLLIYINVASTTASN